MVKMRSMGLILAAGLTVLASVPASSQQQQPTVQIPQPGVPQIMRTTLASLPCRRS